MVTTVDYFAPRPNADIGPSSVHFKLPLFSQQQQTTTNNNNGWSEAPKYKKKPLRPLTLAVVRNNNNINNVASPSLVVASPARAVGPILHPNVHQMNAPLKQSVMDMPKDMQVANSRQVYKSITTEWEAYCAYEWGAKRHDSLPTIVDSAKVYRFMFYHAFREGKKPGGRKKRGVQDSTNVTTRECRNCTTVLVLQYISTVVVVVVKRR
jgi:hypothetical protein